MEADSVSSARNAFICSYVISLSLLQVCAATRNVPFSTLIRRRRFETVLGMTGAFVDTVSGATLHQYPPSHELSHMMSISGVSTDTRICCNPNPVTIGGRPLARLRITIMQTCETPTPAEPSFVLAGPNCKNRHVRRVMCINYLCGFCLDGPNCKFVQ